MLSSRVFNTSKLLFVLATLASIANPQLERVSANTTRDEVPLPGTSNPEWQAHLENAYEAIHKTDNQSAFKELHLALLSPSLSQENVRKLLLELVNLYNLSGQNDKGKTISALLLTPAYTPEQSSIIKAYNLSIRKKAILKAADSATQNNDYLLADLLYNSLLPGPSVYAKLMNRDSGSDDYELKVVDRLVRLYIKNGDYNRALALIKAMTAIEELVEKGEAKSDANQIKLAMLKINLAMVYMHQDSPQRAIKIFQKNIIKLERLLKTDKGILATAYNDYALALCKVKKYSEAKWAYKKALAILNQANSVQDQNQKTIRSNYAKFLDRQKL